MPWRRTWQPTPAFLPGESHGQRSLVGYSPRDLKELDMTEHILYTLGISLCCFAWNFPCFNTASPASPKPPPLVCLTLSKLLIYVHMYVCMYPSIFIYTTHTYTYTHLLECFLIEELFYNNRTFHCPSPPIPTETSKGLKVAPNKYSLNE